MGFDFRNNRFVNDIGTTTNRARIVYNNIINTGIGIGIVIRVQRIFDVRKI